MSKKERISQKTTHILDKEFHFDSSQLGDIGTISHTNIKEDYRISTIADIPRKIHGDFVETPVDDGPWGARGVGEHVMVQTAPAIANALYDAVGIRFSDLPLSADKIYLAIDEAQE